jgi:hypothetical protein
MTEGEEMSDDIIQAMALAGRISAMAEDVLSGIDRSMKIMKWPNEFKIIVWEAIAAEASSRAEMVLRRN